MVVDTLLQSPWQKLPMPRAGEVRQLQCENQDVSRRLISAIATFGQRPQLLCGKTTDHEANDPRIRR